LHKEDMINRPDLYRKDRRTCLSIQIEPERKSQKHHSQEIKAFSQPVTTTKLHVSAFAKSIGAEVLHPELPLALGAVK
jgi:hypothetical protein